MKIAFLYTIGRLRRAEKVAQGIAPTDFFYGSEELRAKGHEIALFEIPEQPQRSLASRLIETIGNLGIFRARLPMKVTGKQLAQTREIAEAVSQFDVVVVAGTGTAFAMDIWRFLGRVKCPVVGIHCGFLNISYTPSRRWITSFLLNRTWTMLFGDGEYQPLIDLFGVNPERVYVNQCGTDTHFWTPGNGDGGGDYVLAVGNDGRRDYDVLMQAAARCQVPFMVVTTRTIKETIPPNVKIVAGHLWTEILTDVELRDLFRKAKCVVTPLVETKQPSGQSVCLQAMACGRPAILTRTEGLWSERIMRDDENVLLVPPYDPEALSTAIHRIFADARLEARLGQAGRESVCRELTMEHYAERLEEFIQTRVLSLEKRTATAPVS